MHIFIAIVRVYVSPSLFLFTIRTLSAHMSCLVFVMCRRRLLVMSQPGCPHRISTTQLGDDSELYALGNTYESFAAVLPLRHDRRPTLNSYLQWAHARTTYASYG
jgi:hypothetical protein